MGGRSSKTKPARTQPATVVESFTPPDGGDDAASANGKRTSEERQSSQRRVVKEIWNSKPVEAAAPQPSPAKRPGLQMSSEDEADVERKARELERKKSKKRRGKGSREQEAPVQRASPAKLNEVQVVKKPPADVSAERVQRFEQIKVAYSLRDLASRKVETPSPSRAESKAESLALFYGGRDAKPSASGSATTNGGSAMRSKPIEGSIDRPPSSSSPSCHSDSSPRLQTKDEQVHQFGARQPEHESTELLDIDELEREESSYSSAPASRAAASSSQRLTLTPASKALEPRSASLPNPPAQPYHQLKSPGHSLRLDDVDESIMSAILMETPPRTAGGDRRL